MDNVTTVMVLAPIFVLFSVFAGSYNVDCVGKTVRKTRLIPLGFLRYFLPHYAYGVGYEEISRLRFRQRRPLKVEEYRREISVNVLWSFVLEAIPAVAIEAWQCILAFFPNGASQLVLNMLFLFFFVYCVGVEAVFSLTAKKPINQ
jgi:hypothetical protein